MTSTSTLGNDSPVSSPNWLSRIRAARGYDTAVRAIGCAWFLVLALILAHKAFVHAIGMRLADFGSAGWPELLATICLFLFYLALWWFILVRPSPAARSAGTLPSVIGFAGTYLPWTMVLFAPSGTSAGRSLASAALLLIGTVLMVVVIAHLGRSFSIVPQARRLVRTGPYGVVRNPLYLAEEIAILGALLQFYSVMTLLLFVAHGILQISRIFYEESVLRRTFPGYEDYAKSTPRLLPYVW